MLKLVLEKFDAYIAGITLLPPPKPGEQPPQAAANGSQPQPQPEDKDKINVLVLVDDSDSRKMSKFELKEKLTTIMANIAQDIDKNLAPQTMILSELWQNCYDGKYELLQLIAMSAPIYDKGMLAAIKMAIDVEQFADK